MRTFTDMPINRKLTLLVLLAGGVTILLSSAALMVNNFYLLRSSKVQELHALASVLGANSTAALTFDDPAAARDVLTSLRLQPAVEFACIYNIQRESFATYANAAAAKQPTPPLPAENGHNVAGFRHVDITQPIVQGGHKVGTIYVRATFQDLFVQLVRSMVVVVVLILFSVGNAVVLSSRLQRSVSKPILELAEAAQKISADRDYSIRVQKQADDEIGTLCDEFNAMLGEIQQRQRQLHEAHGNLEVRVEERTRQLASAVRELRREVADRQRTEDELKKVHQQLIETARQAGMAEIATGVLHNVGNVLNSVNVSATLVSDRLRKLRVGELSRALDILEANAAEIGRFFTEDEKGKQLPGFLRLVTNNLARDRSLLLEEIQSLIKNLDHIKTIVAMQQSYAGVAGIVESVDVAGLMDDALKMVASSLQKYHIEIVREYDELPAVQTQKQKLLQILVNLATNAKDALAACDRSERRLVVRIGMRYAAGQDRVAIEVSDNGLGIQQENITKIFSHGFTTKKHGHGFGLHSSANAARELGGSLSAHSDGPGRGASFTVELPFQTCEVPA
jgi:signal transduction histidine kinase